ncbi:permease-like cell division protein FtsX [Streptosporangium sp. NPDC006007]|uniref:permease-like cell division protein FtsX n=1 Tax=Streptosporangium sp. NPDC006007 TaxID=3154575 RepID=UPI0033A39AE4
MTVTENRLRDALSAAATTTVDARPLTTPARRRSRVPVALAAAVTVAAVGTGFLWAQRADPQPTVAAAQAGPVPQPELEISVFLCRPKDFFPRCKGVRTEKAKIAEALWSRPDVGWIAFDDNREAWEKFKRQYRDDSALAKAITVEDMPEVFRVIPTSGADRKRLADVIGRLPGVSNVVDDKCRAHSVVAGNSRFRC